MTYKMTLRSNPRLLFVWMIIPGLPVLGVLLWMYLGGIIGVAAIIGALFLSSQIYRFTISHMKQRVETSEEGIVCHVSENDVSRLRWDALSYAGLCHQKRGVPFIFLYGEQDDQLLTIPKEFSAFDTLLKEVKDNINTINTISFQEIRLAKNETIQDWIRSSLREGEEA